MLIKNICAFVSLLCVAVCSQLADDEEKKGRCANWNGWGNGLQN